MSDREKQLYQYGQDAYIIGHPNMPSTSLNPDLAAIWSKGWTDASMVLANQMARSKNLKMRAINDGFYKRNGFN